MSDEQILIEVLLLNPGATQRQLIGRKGLIQKYMRENGVGLEMSHTFSSTRMLQATADKLRKRGILTEGYSLRRW